MMLCRKDFSDTISTSTSSGHTILGKEVTRGVDQNTWFRKQTKASPWDRLPSFAVFLTQDEDLLRQAMTYSRRGSKEERIIEGLVDQLDNNFPLCLNMIEEKPTTQEDVMALVLQYVMSTEAPNYGLIFRVFQSLNLGNSSHSIQESQTETSFLTTPESNQENDISLKTRGSNIEMFEMTENRPASAPVKKKLKRQTSLLDRILRRTRSSDSSKDDDVCNLLKRLSKYSLDSPPSSSITDLCL